MSPHMVTERMFRLTPIVLLLALGCEADHAPEARPAAAPVRSAPVAAADREPRVQLSEADAEAVLRPARDALGAAELDPLPLTLTDAQHDDPLYDAVVDLLLAHLRITRVRVGAHTDPRGSAEYNQRVSLERAETVARALVDRGIGCARLEAVGYGETRPLLDAPMGEQRRIELSFIRVDETAMEPLNEDVCGLGPALE